MFQVRAETFVVRYCVLHDESIDPLRVGQGHAKAHRAAVVLHVQRVAQELSVCVKWPMTSAKWSKV